MKWRDRWIVLAVLFGFSWALVLAVSPALHETIHADAGRVEHTCAVTLFSSGSVHQAPSVARVEPSSPVLISEVGALKPQWVHSAFLEARIFEHAPPFYS